MAAIRLLDCVTDIEAWMSSNRLKLNADKMEFLWLGTRQQLAKLISVSLPMNGQLKTSSVDVSISCDNCAAYGGHFPLTPAVHWLQHLLPAELTTATQSCTARQQQSFVG